ncbi:hypothetical protein N3C_2483 [Clostridium sp. N3C]|nr:hypothetical protein N3C_2483 [Clostridium sp. N3C]
MKIFLFLLEIYNDISIIRLGENYRIKIMFPLCPAIQCGTIYLEKGEVFMSTITVRLNSEEERIHKEYAEFKNIPLSTLMKEALEKN